MNEQRIKEVFSDELFMAELLQMETAEEVQAALKAKGVEFSTQDIYNIRDIVINYANLDELSDSELEEVAGGFVMPTISSDMFKLIFKGITTAVKMVATVHELSNGRW